jgi:hypothetical protein
MLANQRDAIWIIAEASVARIRPHTESEKGSQPLSAHVFGWEPVKQYFVTGFVDTVGEDACQWTYYPCERALAEEILDYCRTAKVQQRLLRNHHSGAKDDLLEVMNDTLVSFRRSSAVFEGRRCVRPAFFSFHYYGPNYMRHHIRFGLEIGKTFAENIKAETSETIRSKLRGVSATA